MLDRRWILIALALCFSGQLALADRRASRDDRDDMDTQRDALSFLDRHYDRKTLENLGRNICEKDEASSESNLRNFIDSGNELSVRLKRDLMIYYAVGFAKVYNEHRTRREIAEAAEREGKAPLLSCAKDDRTCTRVADAIRKVSLGVSSKDVRPGKSPPDWCAGFISTLANMVDDQVDGGHSNLIHTGKKSWGATNYASAEKLLSLFDPSEPVRPDLFGGHRPRKKKNSFLPANRKPIPGCMAVYKDLYSNEGHVALVISSNDSGRLQTIEGNSAPWKGSAERGVFAHTDRKWGADASIEYSDSVTKKPHHMVYRGCVLPWPGMAKLPDDRVCSEGATDASLKLYRNDSGTPFNERQGSSATSGRAE